MSNINNILNKIAKAEKVELAKHEVELALVDDIKKAAESVEKQYQSVFSKVISVKTQIDEALKIGNKAFFESQKFYQQGLKAEQQAKELGITMPSDFQNAMKILYQKSQLEGEQVIKDLTSAKKLIG